MLLGVEKLFHSMEVDVSVRGGERGGLSCKGQHHQDFKTLILRKREKKNASLTFHCVNASCRPSHVLFSSLSHSCVRPLIFGCVSRRADVK